MGDRIEVPKLTRTAIEEWLVRQPGDREFVCGDVRRCLIAEYLHDHGFINAEVGWHWYPYGGIFAGGEQRPLPLSLNRLAQEFDRLYKKRVTPGMKVNATLVRQELFNRP